MDVPGISRPVLVAMIVVAVLLIAAGAAWGLSWVTTHTETHTRTFPAASSIVVDGNSGDVVVVGSDRTDVLLTTKEDRSVFGRPHTDVGYADGRLHLDGDCSESLWGACDISYRLEVPRNTAVKLLTQSGDVSAEDLDAAADLQTRSGDVDAVGVLGKLRLQTRSGDVDVEAASTDIDADTRSGDVHVRATNAERVRAQTSSGDVHISVPDRTYAVRTSADSGDEHVDVRRDPRAPRSIDASTSSGDVDIGRDG